MSRLLSWTLLFCLLTQSGCYYGHLASGQLRLLWRRQPISEAIVDPAHSEEVRALLGLAESVRSFARDLGLSVGDQYTSFVEWPGDRVVTTLVRTRPGSLTPVPHRFPFVGELPYKGFFDRAWAEAEAARWRTEDGFDVCVSAISAYSTLGWFADPITSPMLARGAAALVETMLHELVHATAFLPDAADFNESVAQFIGQEAAVRFFAEGHHNAAHTPVDPAVVRQAIEDRDTIRSVIVNFRNRLLEIEHASDRVAQRARFEREARREISQLPLRVLDAEAVAAKSRLSDACLALRGTYVSDAPRHQKVLADLDGDLETMIERLSSWAETGRPAPDFYDVAIAPSSVAD